MSTNHEAMNDDGVVVLADTLDMDPNVLKHLRKAFSELFPSPDNNYWWNDINRAIEAGTIITQRAKLPFADQHQQPHDMARLVRTLAPIHSDLVDDVDELRGNRIVFLLLVYQFDEWFMTLPFAMAIERIRTASILYMNRFGPIGRAELWRRLSEVLSIVEWFADTEGLHDPESGVVDVEAAALRAFMKETNLDESR